jgi:hypothetical protein
MFDPKCSQLAEDFLTDSIVNHEVNTKMIDALAQEIQDVIEDFIRRVKGE